MWLIASGFLIHIIFLASIFDAYFKTPITPVGTQYKSNSEHIPAKRLVLFVADGLRAQTLYDYKFSKPNPISDDVSAVFLKSIINRNAPWGVSYTQVPTESRPGHIALIGGFYEDPSAITRGWKYNPVDFDSVLNQTTESWCWGASDILEIFSKDDNHVHLNFYGPDEIDFASQGAHILDDWVFDKVEKFFQNVTAGSELHKKLHQGKIMFFLHLLGTDTIGHSKKPESKFYLDSIANVDSILSKIVKIIGNFYNDQQTAYVFTSDHGMTNWGSHGAGHPTETDCPIVAWGAGISDLPTINVIREKIEVTQADISVLMSILLGINIPMNSVGILPDKFLSLPDNEIAEGYLANLRVVIEQYHTKKAESKNFHWLKTYRLLDGRKLDIQMGDILQLMMKNDFKNAISKTRELIKTVLDGVKFYHNFYQTPILFSVSVSVLLWIILLLECVLRENVQQFNSKKNDKLCSQDVFPYSLQSYLSQCIKDKITGFVIIITSSLTILIVFAFNIPKMCCVYFVLPQVLIFFLSITKKTWLDSFKYLSNYNTSEIRQLIASVLCYVILLELVIQVFFYRWVLTILITGVACWTFYSTKQVLTKKLTFSWFSSSIMLAVFPFLPVIGSNANVGILTIGGMGWFFTAIAVVYFIIAETPSQKLSSSIFFGLCQIGFVIFAIIVSVVVRSGGLPSNFQTETQLMSAAIAGCSTLIPFISSTRMLIRLGKIAIGLSVPYTLMSVTYEPLFLLILSTHLYVWLQIEHKLVVTRDVNTRLIHTTSDLNDARYMLKSKSFEHSNTIFERSQERVLSGHDFRRAFCYMFYILFSFFGTGNIASISSFDPMWVVCFISVFSPFLMTVLILCKILIVFIIVSCFFRAINIVVSGSFQKLLFIILVYCDFLIFHFLFFVKNEGSWLDIGMSISNFVIIETVVLFILVLYYVAYFFTTFSIKR